MQNYHATVRLFDVTGDDLVSAQRALEETLQRADVGRWQVIGLVPEAPPLPVQRFRSPRAVRFGRTVGPLLLLGAAIWAIWFYSLLIE